MTWKNGRKIIAFRRERVASYKLRGFTIREIVDALQKEGLVNPETNQPFSHGTVVTDLKALHKEWMAHAAKDIAAHKADQLAELLELRKRNWETGDLAEVRHCIELEARILGTPAPMRQEHSGPDGAPIQVEEVLTPEERVRRLTALIAAQENKKES